ncbi:hypothetical protein [Exiguobacterium sp. AM39-5BH]|uniref:hypothetical protein n=1 Tax=Exiguobacterium sp. AM39-5BH TaxID=2292355 RepID=UPI000FE1D19E|nr:hypothetical protein [Exiguobacterium sp. AM39-5BH]RHB49299.1 hypothetical protein DW881_08710 [Exiguobacterium sp. AM39-5BH]
MKRTFLVPTLMMAVFLASCGDAAPASESTEPVTEETETSTEQVPDRWKATKIGTEVPTFTVPAFGQTDARSSRRTQD